VLAFAGLTGVLGAGEVELSSVTFKAVEKRFGDTVVLKPLDLAIRDGEFLVLVGASGCGKTTILRIISGLEEVSAGEVCIADRRVNDVAPRDRDIAMVFQNYALYPHMSVYDNMAFGLALRKFPADEIRKRVDKAAAMLGLGKLLDRKPKALSGGQRQRVAMGRAIVREPKVFLFDEPLSNLDAQLRVQMRTEIRKLHRQLQTTMVYVTHDQVEAMTLASRIAVLDGGVLQQLGSPREIFRRPANRFVATFIGSPPMNLIPVTVERRDGALELATKGLRVALPSWRQDALAAYEGRELTLGVRPQHFIATTTGAVAAVMVDAVEPLGSETYAYGRIGGASVTLRLPADTPVTDGDAVDVAVDASGLHMFDVDGKRLAAFDPREEVA